MSNPDEKEKQLLEGYSNRCKNVFNFDQVQIKNPSISGQQDEEKDQAKSLRKRDSEDRFYKAPKRSRSSQDEDPSFESPANTRDFKGRESLFRVPENEEWSKKPASSSSNRDDSHEFRKPKGFGGGQRRGRGRGGGGHGKMPDFAKNPEKYTKYSLKDVDLTNNRSNSEAAFAFLDELRKRNQDGEVEDKFNAHQSGQKIVFKKPTKKKEEKEESSSSSPASKAKKKSGGPTLSFDMDDEEEEG